MCSCHQILPVSCMLQVDVPSAGALQNRDTQHSLLLGAQSGGRLYLHDGYVALDASRALPSWPQDLNFHPHMGLESCKLGRAPIGFLNLPLMLPSCILYSTQ